MPVYFLYQEGHGPDRIKIGRARRVEERRRQLQTGNPDRLKLVGFINADDDARLERDLHRHFAEVRGEFGEWFNLQPADVLPVLQRFHGDAFVGKTADAFEIVGYDRDGIPEHVGVWEWGDLSLEECCPFCGCLGGLHFQEASWMYHCLACDTLTNFEDDTRTAPEP
ncbi:GIY-YIG nuclease family protein [Brevundimonas aurantiaca]|jgi:hypothetical protein|uniref:GIY-YIG nuclease family protein n=1 Tax=Brevundimonas aurantiaca TaxID=74316 RepID=UPI001601897A|nr:GIY-YIG nuclease family protein [Pseudomonas sp. FW305-3-2-15-E-TSA4]